MTNGVWEYDDTGFSQLYLALMTRFGSVPADATLGNRMWLVETISKGTPAEMTGHMIAATQACIDDGVVDTFEVVYCQIHSSNPNRIDYGWHWTAEGQDHYFDGNLAFGSD
jgi:hypothetical protein